jgi:hypothetical protein
MEKKELEEWEAELKRLIEYAVFILKSTQKQPHDC